MDIYNRVRRVLRSPEIYAVKAEEACVIWLDSFLKVRLSRVKTALPLQKAQGSSLMIAHRNESAILTYSLFFLRWIPKSGNTGAARSALPAFPRHNGKLVYGHASSFTIS